MSMRTQTTAAGILLPLATGLLLVGIAAVVPVGGGALLGLMVLLTLGAVLPGRPWRTGAIATAPMVVAAVVAGGEPPGAGEGGGERRRHEEPSPARAVVGERRP